MGLVLLCLAALLCSLNALSDALVLPGDLASAMEIDTVAGVFEWQPDSGRAVVMLAMQQGVAFHDALWRPASIEASERYEDPPTCFACMACAV